MAQDQVPQYTHCVKKTFVAPGAPQLNGAWFDPVQLRHELVLVGLPGTAHLYRCYEENPDWIETLTAAGFRVLLFDYRGHGESTLEQPLRQVHVQNYVQDVIRVLKAAGLAPRQTVLFGHSLGGAVALEVAAEAQAGEEAFAGVVILGGVAPDRWRGIYLRGLPGNFVRYPRAVWRAMQNPQEFFLDETLGRKLLFQPSTPLETVSRARKFTCPESVRAIFDLCFTVKTRPLRAKRILFLSGANDRCVEPDMVYQSAKDYQRLHCQADFVSLADTPHDLMIDGRVREAAHTLVQFAERLTEEV